MTATAHQTFSLLYHALSGGSSGASTSRSHWYALPASSYSFRNPDSGSNALVHREDIIVFPRRRKRGSNGVWRPITPTARRSRRAEYTCAFLCLILAALCAVPAVPPAVTFAVGILGATAAAAYGWARRQAQGMRRGAALAERGLPGPLFLSAYAASLRCSSMRSIPRCGPVRSGRGRDRRHVAHRARAIDGATLIPRRRSRIGDSLGKLRARRSAVTIASLMTTVTMLCSSLVITLAPHHLATATIDIGTDPVRCDWCR